MKKIKILSVFLSIILCLTAMPFTGLTAFASTSENYEYTVLSETDKTCEITKYTGAGGDVTIPSTIDGYAVTSIGDYAFDRFTSLTSITIPDSVTSIEWYAFQNCTSLTSVTIPNSVTSIGGYAFYGCTSLTSVTIPDSVMSIGKRAFYNCTSLTSVTIGNSVTSIEEKAFSYCTSLTSVTIPNSVTSIGNSAFEKCESLTSVTIPDSVTSIGQMAFWNCKSLTEINVSENNINYSSADGVLFDKNRTELIGYPAGKSDKSYTIPDSVVFVVFEAFSYCTSLTEINVSENNINYSSAGGVLFNKNKTELIRYPEGKPDKSYTIPDGVTSIGLSAFYNCTALTSVTIPDSVTSIEGSSFENCISLTSILIPDSVTSIEWNAFYNCTSLTSITIPDSVTSIGYCAFENCTSLTSVTIPDSVTSIGYCAFENCTSITSITIPDSVTSIGDDAFKNCTSLASVTIGNSVTSIGDDAFENCTSLASVTIGNSVTSIGDDAFENCTSLTNVTIPDSVTSIGDYVFLNCTSLASVTIGNSVTSIGDDAFENCTSLTSVTIPDSVTSIGDYVFLNCTSLTSVTIGNSVTSIGWSAFYNCTSLTSVTIGNSVTSIGDSAFSDCASLTSVTIPDSVTSIGDGAFGNCESLTSVTIPDSVMSIGVSTFSHCTSLASVTIPNSVTSIESGSFENCTSLTSITIPNSVTSIGGYAFYDCTSLASVTIPNSVTSIGGYAFYDCTSLASVTIPNSVTSIGNYAFERCKSLTSVTIPDSVTIIGDGAFYNCTSLTSVTIPDSVTSIERGSFENCTSLTSVTIPDSVTSIGDYVFWNCTSLTSVTIPDSVTSIGDGAFGNCESLTSVTIPDSVMSIRVSTFVNCTSLRSVTIPDSVTSIGNYAFERCKSLTSVTIPDSVTSIGDDAFSDCASLTSVTIPDSVTSIGWSAFWNCRFLTIYGIKDSYAQTYALRYGISFDYIPNDAAQSNKVYRNNVQLNIFERDAFLNGNINFVSVNTSANEQHKLNGVTLQSNGTSNTFDKSFAFASDQLGSDIKLSKANYQNYIIPLAVMQSWMESDDLSTHNIYMAKDKKDGKPYISGTFGKEANKNVAYTDLQSESLTVLSGKQYDILLCAELRGESASEYVLSQDDAHKVTSKNGAFSAETLSKVFTAGKKVYAYVKTVSGKTSEPIELNLDITNVSLNSNKFSLMGNSGQNITLDKNNPLVGGATISMDGFSFPLGVEVEGNRFRISFGIDLFSIKKENNQLWGKKDGTSTWEFFKTNVSDITDSVESSTEKLKKFNNFYKVIAPNQSYNNKNQNFDVSFLGYAEGYIVDGKFVFTDSCGEITGKFSFQYTQQGTIWAIPVYAYVEAGAGLSVKAQNIRLFPDSDVPFDFGMSLKVEPELKIGAGIGVEGAVSGGLYGKGSLPFENNFSTKHTVVKLNGQIGVEGEFFCFSGKKEIISGSATLWDNYYGSPQAFRAMASGSVFLPKQTEKMKTKTTVMSRNYAENTSRWLGDNSITRLFRSRSVISDGVTIKELQKSVFKNSEPQLVVLDDGRMVLAYIEDASNRDTYNRMRLVYSIYENGFWSTPKAVDDDGTNDASPTLVSDGKNVYIAWQDLNCTLKVSDADSIDTILQSSEICFATLNTETNTFENSVMLTSNSIYDYSPRIAAENGNVVVYWVENEKNDLTAAQSNTIYRYIPANDKTEAVALSVNYIADMECSFVNGTDEVSYSTDTDGILSTTGDVSVFTIANETQKQISDSNFANFDIAYGSLNGKNTLFYANNSGIYYYSNGKTNYVFHSPRRINGDLQVLENGIETKLLWSEVSDAGTELWICNYSGGSWSEPVQITNTGALLHGVSAVCNNGIIYGVFDRTARALVNGEYTNGQTDLCSMTLTDYADLEVGFALIDESSFVAGEESDISISLKNNGTKDISSVDIKLCDALGTEITVSKEVDLPSGSEAITNITYPVPIDFDKTTLSVNVSVPDKSEINTANNSCSEEIGFTNISIREIKRESVGEYYIFTSVVTNNSLLPAENVEVKIYETENDNNLLNIVNIGTLQSGESYSVQYIVKKNSLNFDSEKLCTIKFAGSTDSIEKSDADNNSFAVCKKETAVLCGDVNNDGIIDAADAVVIQRYDAGIITLTAEQFSAGDVNGDNIVDAADAVKIQRYDAGIISNI